MLPNKKCYSSVTLASTDRNPENYNKIYQFYVAMKEFLPNLRQTLHRGDTCSYDNIAQAPVQVVHLTEIVMYSVHLPAFFIFFQKE